MNRDSSYDRGAEAMRMAVLALFEEWFLAKESLVTFVQKLRDLKVTESSR